MINITRKPFYTNQAYIMKEKMNEHMTNTLIMNFWGRVSTHNKNIIDCIIDEILENINEIS